MLTTLSLDLSYILTWVYNNKLWLICAFNHIFLLFRYLNSPHCLSLFWDTMTSSGCRTLCPITSSINIPPDSDLALFYFLRCSHCMTSCTVVEWHIRKVEDFMVSMLMISPYLIMALYLTPPVESGLARDLLQTCSKETLPVKVWALQYLSCYELILYTRRGCTGAVRRRSQHWETLAGIFRGHVPVTQTLGFYQLYH